MRFSELANAKLAIWGYGREGHAALTALRRRYPEQAVTLYCSAEEALLLRGAATKPGVDLRLDRLAIVTQAPDAAMLSAHAVVIKSPGISAYRPELLAAQAAGTRFTSGTALWFADNPEARVVAVTGTKGKSTTTALIAHLARALGERTALAGNIGLPLLDLDGQHAELWAIELSSYQTGEAGPLELGVVVSLAEEHLDWHGSRERYVADKLKLADVAQGLLVDAQAPLLLKHTASHPQRHLFDTVSGWHVAGAHLCRGDAAVIAVADLPLHGLHNARNACAALAAIELLGFDTLAAAPALKNFQPLPHRLTALGRRAGLDWIDDSISTTPDAALAALQSLAGRAVSLILGGFDRGLDWNACARELVAHPPHALVLNGAAAPRIAASLREAGFAGVLATADDFADAVRKAQARAANGGVVLLSPGAPSFDQFHDYAERGRAFAELAGFAGAAIGGIAGLGIA